jgi:formylglycine-generating enzyme required for sulfatase activity
LTQIAGTPLFCSALVQVYKYHGAELPQRRVDVLAEIVDLLLGYWHAQQRVPDPQKLAQEDGTERQYRDLDDAVQHKLRRLSHVAYAMQDVAHEAELGAETVQQVLADYLQQRERVGDAERALRLAGKFLFNSHERGGLLVENNPGVYAFVHQNFMEFLAATALVNRSSQLVDTVLQHLTDPWWEQVILLAGAHPKTPDDVRENLICALLEQAQASPRGTADWQRALMMAGRLAGDMGGHLAGPEHAAVEEALYTAVTASDLSPALRANLADVLDVLWLPPDLHSFVPVPDAAAPQFWLARYPVTNGQYARFLLAEDFGRQEYWSGFPKVGEPGKYKNLGDWGDTGWKWLQEVLQHKEASLDGKRVLPRYWNDPRFGIVRRGAPVVTVTWYEANAYCKWLLAHWDELEESQQNLALKPARLRLPLEREWELAAGGTQPEDRYPWDAVGQATDDAQEILRRANVGDEIGRTTPVGMYPSGASQPYGLFDLAGNVWEWQANYLDEVMIFGARAACCSIIMAAHGR